MRFSKVMLGIAALAIATVVQAAPLWQSFDLGASKEQVLGAFPHAKLDKANSSAGLEKFRVEGVPETGMWTDLTFSDGLREVKMYGRGADNYLRIVEGLTRKYGKPLTSSLAAKSGLSTWESGPVQIVAKLEMDQALGAGFIAREPFSVTYSGKISEELDKGL